MPALYGAGIFLYCHSHIFPEKLSETFSEIKLRVLTLPPWQVLHDQLLLNSPRTGM